jgi:hypothetical protein
MQFILISWPPSKPGLLYGIIPIDFCISEPKPWCCVQVKIGNKENHGTVVRIGNL